MLKLKLQYFGHLMQRADSFEKTPCWERLRAGGEGDDRGWDGRMASPTQWTWVWISPRSWWGTGRPGGLQFMGSQRVRHDWATELNWTADSQLRLSSLRSRKKKRMMKNEQSWWGIIKCANIHITDVSDGGEREGAERILKQIMTKTPQIW